jgi:hypothetical protein
MMSRQKELNFFEYLYNGLLKFKEVIAVNNKLEKVCDRYVTVLNNTLKPTKPFYKMMLEKHNVHPTESQEKWQIRLTKSILHFACKQCAT